MAFEPGPVQVNSALGEPLRAQFLLPGLNPEERVSLRVRMAGTEIYERFKKVRVPWIDTLRFQVETRPEGGIVLIESDAAVSDTLVDLVFELDWIGGRRLYPQTVRIESRAAGAEPLLIKPPAIEPVTIESPAGKLPAPAPSAPYTVKRGDTLLGIARHTRLVPVTLEQQVVGIYEANAAVFPAGNPDRLRPGDALTLPSEAQLRQMDAFSARQRYWQILAAAQAGNAAEKGGTVTPAQAAKGAGQGKVVAAAPTAALPAESTDVIRVSRAASPDARANDTLDRVQMLEEEGAARRRALAEAQNRIAHLEKTVAELQGLLARQGRKAEQEHLVQAAVNESRVLGLPPLVWAALIVLSVLFILGLWQIVRRRRIQALLATAPSVAGIDLNLNRPASDDDASRLSMARACLSLGDAGGARALLARIVAGDSDPAVRAEAERLLAGLDKA